MRITPERQPRFRSGSLRLGIFVALFFALGGCFGAQAPERIVVQYGAWPSSPVLLQNLVVNEVSLSQQERFIAGRWKDPKGGSAYSLGYPEHQTQKGQMDIAVQWTDLRHKQGYATTMTLSVDDLADVTVTDPAVSLIVLLGPGGYFEIATDAAPDETGQYNGRIVKTTCADMAEAIAADHWIWEDARLMRALNLSDPAPDMGCPK